MLHSLPGDFDVVKCRVCELMRTNPRPTPDSIGAYYPSDYGPYLGTTLRAEQPASGLKRILRPLVRSLFDDRAKKIPKAAPGRLLEIGCASGSFLHEMAALGWEVEGIEFSEAPAKLARNLGFKVQTGALELAEAPAQPVDLVVGWMVLEHLHDPVTCLKKLAEWTTADAKLVLSVPNAGSLEFEIFKNQWYSLHLPAHFYHFTPSSLRNILATSGWKLEEVFHQPSLSNLFMSLAYWLEGKGRHALGGRMRKLAFPSGWWFYATYPVAWLFAAFGQTGRMTVWARKWSQEDHKSENTRLGDPLQEGG
jgi:SAM-dependent methyltransferase